MTIASKTLAAALTLGAALASGQTVAGPVMGFVIDGRGHSLHPVLGVPGAAVVGDAVKTTTAVIPESVSPTGDYAIVWNGGRAAVWMPGGAMQTIGQLPPGRTPVTFSPRGAAAGFFSPSEGVVRVVGGLPSATSDAAEFRLDTLGGVCGNLAISDDGTLVLCSSAAEAVVLGSSGELARIPFGAAITALAFVPGAHDAVIATGGDAFLVREVEAHGSAARLDTAGLDSISSAIVTSDGTRALLADAGSRKLAVLSLATDAQPTLLDCHCTPEGFFRINGSGAYRLGGYSGAAMRILDTASTPPRIVVVTPSLNPGNSQ